MWTTGSKGTRRCKDLDYGRGSLKAEKGLHPPHMIISHDLSYLTQDIAQSITGVKGKLEAVGESSAALMMHQLVMGDKVDPR